VGVSCRRTVGVLVSFTNSFTKKGGETNHDTVQTILPPSTVSLLLLLPSWWMVSTSSLTAARTSVPPPGFLPMLTLALPLAKGATSVWRETVRKSCRVRPSARKGGFESRDDWMYDFSALDNIYVRK